MSPRYCLRLVLYLMSSLLCFFLQAQEQGSEEYPHSQVNLLFYLYEETPNYKFTSILPVYSYSRYPNHLKENFWFWPLLAGYDVSKNPVPDIFPFADEFQWYTLPFLSSGYLKLSPTENANTSTMVSFLFMTYFQESQIDERYFARHWYSLPALSYYNSETLRGKNTEIVKIAWGNPLFSFQETRLVYGQKIFPVYDWALEPADLLLGEDSVQILRHARWGRDHLFQMVALDSFAVFSISTTYSLYPGSQYYRLIYYESDNQEQTIRNLMKTPVAFPKTRMGIVAPFLQFETSPVGHFSWQLLPFVHYLSEGNTSRFYLIPLGLEFGSEGMHFSPQPRFFPIIYHDEMYGSWDILWPLFRYVDDPQMPGERITLRFVFDYCQRSDADGKGYLDFSILERLLISYYEAPGKSHFEILPAGLLFGYYSTEGNYQWRVLGCGYWETERYKYLQIFFMKISLQEK